MFWFSVDRTVHFHYCITLPIIRTGLKKVGSYCWYLSLYCSSYYRYCFQKKGLYHLGLHLCTFRSFKKFFFKKNKICKPHIDQCSKNCHNFGINSTEYFRNNSMLADFVGGFMGAPRPKNSKLWNYIGGRSQTTWTNFWPILTTYLPIVDFRGHLVHHLPLVQVDI